MSSQLNFHGIKKELSIYIALVAAVWIVFGQTLGFEFVNYDDGVVVSTNPRLAEGWIRGLQWAFTGTEAGNWIPVTVLSHLLDRQLFGTWAGGHHLTNVLLHTAGVLTLFAVLRTMTGAVWRSAAVAMAFAIHPLRAESVAWVAERKDVLSGLFFLLTLGAYLRYIRRPVLSRYAAVGLLFTLGLLSKPMLVTLPCVLWLLDYWPLQRWKKIPLRQLVLEKLPLLALSAGACATALWANHGALVPVEQLPLGLRFGNAAVSSIQYLRQWIWPTGLAAFYPHPKMGLPSWQIALSGILLVAISAAVVVARRKCPFALAGWLWYLGMLVPVSGLVQAGALAGADRYTYLPQIGIAIILVWGVAARSADWRWRKLAGAGAAALLAPAWIATARVQTGYWHHSEALWRHTLACTRENPSAHAFLGLALHAQGRGEEALPEYEQAVALRPNGADNQFNLAWVLLERGRREEAIAHLRRALALRPDYLEALNGLGLFWAKEGKTDAAIDCYRTALEAAPAHAGLRVNLGLALVSRGKPREGMENFHQALAADPESALALNNLAWLLATSPDDSIRHGAEAVELAQRANALAHGRDPTVLDTLAAAYAEAGRFPEAEETATRALQLAINQRNTSLAATLKTEIALYEARKTLREQHNPVTSNVP